MVIDGEQKRFLVKGEVYHCSLDVTMHFIGGKWKTVVLWYLRTGTKRFHELRTLIPDITEKMLTLQLRQLQADGLINREVFAEIPPRVEYSLTERGRTLIPLLEAIASWGYDQAMLHGELVSAEQAHEQVR